MKNAIALFLALCLTLALSCALADGLSIDHLTVTYVTSPLNIPSIVEKENHIFENTLGIPVDYAEITSGADQTQALASGDVQLLYAVGGTSVILSAANGADIKVLNMYSRAPEAFCMYSKDDSLTTPESLRGKVIAGPAGTNLHELLVAYLNTAGMTIDDVQYISMGIPESKAALDGGSADVALLGGAAAYNASKQGYHLVASGKGLIKAIIAVAVTQAFADAHPDVIAALSEAEQKIMDTIQADPEAAYALAASYLDLTPDAVRDMAAAYDFSLAITQEDKAGFQNTADFMSASQMIDEPYDVIGLFMDDAR
ncbi:MAG: NrtA/SsuA/CpmA family ABC transporter substrate-binding protein [Clostridia bacterium]|nr:NrtA/SsuA/CpmA family ABC transporter substrate-binding protein [Clostridia bacterium]